MREKNDNCVRHLVIGGAASGKSRYAETLVEKLADARTYIATAQAFDQEMQDKIAQHRARRAEGWTTVEAPLELAQAIRTVRDPVVLVDCATLWLSNVILAEKPVDPAVDEFLGAVRDATSQMVIVTNETGLGVVPDTPLGRRFRQAQGELNQKLAAACDRVDMVVAGLPMVLK